MNGHGIRFTGLVAPTTKPNGFWAGPPKGRAGRPNGRVSFVCTAGKVQRSAGMVVVLLGHLLVSGCLSKKNAVVSGVQPDLTGSWTGSTAVNGQSPSCLVNLSLNQKGTNLIGTYTSTDPSSSSVGLRLGSLGDVTGLTTGASFLITLKSKESGCSASVDFSGTVSENRLAFSMHGSTCTGEEVRGQGNLQRVLVMGNGPLSVRDF